MVAGSHGAQQEIFISVLTTEAFRPSRAVTAEAPIAESAIAARNPPWIRPAGLAIRSSAVMAHTVTPGADLSTQLRPRVRSQLGGICRATSEASRRGRAAATQSVGSLAVGDQLFRAPAQLEGRAIREIAAVAMDAPGARPNRDTAARRWRCSPRASCCGSRCCATTPRTPRGPTETGSSSGGHASILQYGLAHAFGYDSRPAICGEFRQRALAHAGPPRARVTPTVEVTTGPLGQGIANGVGMADRRTNLRARFGEDLVDHRTG